MTLENSKESPMQKYNKKVEDLLHSSVVSYNIMEQASKGIDCCELSSEFKFSSQHLELERILLISSKCLLTATRN